MMQVKKMLERVNNEVEGVFSKRSKHYLYVHIYILMCLNVFVFVIRSFYIPVVSHFHYKGAKSLCAEFNLNILYLIENMLDLFFSVTT